MDEKKRRNILGTLGWFAVAVLINLFALPLMEKRELEQSREYGFGLELDDIDRYSHAILYGSLVNFLLLCLVVGLISETV